MAGKRKCQEKEVAGKRKREKLVSHDFDDPTISEPGTGKVVIKD